MFAIPSSMARPRSLSPQRGIDSRQSADSVQSRKPVGSIVCLRPIPIRQPAPRSASLFTMPREPEDARITGGTRSLDRRLLALNLSGIRASGIRATTGQSGRMAMLPNPIPVHQTPGSQDCQSDCVA